MSSSCRARAISCNGPPKGGPSPALRASTAKPPEILSHAHARPIPCVLHLPEHARGSCACSRGSSASHARPLPASLLMRLMRAHTAVLICWQAALPSSPRCRHSPWRSGRTSRRSCSATRRLDGFPAEWWRRSAVGRHRSTCTGRPVSHGSDRITGPTRLLVSRCPLRVALQQACVPQARPCRLFCPVVCMS